MDIREHQVKSMLSELLSAVRELQSPTWPLVKPKPISPMEIGLPSHSATVLWPEENHLERAVVIERGFQSSLHLNDESLAWRVSVPRVRLAIQTCQRRIAEAKEQAAAVLASFPNEVARLENELNALLLLGEAFPETRQDYRLLLPVAWRIHRLSLQAPGGAIGRVIAGLVTNPIDHFVSLIVNIGPSHIVNAAVRSEYYGINVALRPERVTVFLENHPVSNPFGPALSVLARVAPDPYRAVRVAELLDEILLRLEGKR